MLNFTRDHSVADSLQYAITWNMAMLQVRFVKAAMGVAITVITERSYSFQCDPPCDSTTPIASLTTAL
jgi:hypothetical protein